MLTANNPIMVASMATTMSMSTLTSASAINAGASLIVWDAIIQASPLNDGYIFIGDSNCASDNSLMLGAGGVLHLNSVCNPHESHWGYDLGKIYLMPSSEAQVARIMYWKRGV